MTTKKRKKMPFKKMWQKFFTREYGEAKTNDLMTRIQKKYHELCANHKEITNRALINHLYDNIFPQMAAYKIFLEDGKSKEDAFGITEKLHFLTLDKQKRDFKILSRFPFCLAYIRMLTPRTIKTKHPPEGWTFEWVENSKNCINYKAKTCFYYDIIKEYGIPEFTLIYCNGDDYVYDVDSPHIKWGRQTTMTRGGDYCDIIFHKISKKNKNKEKSEISDK